MRRLGLIGGTGWASTAEYYRQINELANLRQGGKDFALLTLDSLNLGDIIRNNDAGRFADNEGIVVDAAKRLRAGGAEAIIICANTLHLFTDAVESASGLPVIHIAKATSDAARDRGVASVGLLGTRYTMQDNLYQPILAERGIRCLIPEPKDFEFIHNTIADEMALGKFLPGRKEQYLEVIRRLADRGAEGVILGCTEIPLIVSVEEIPIPSFDTTAIHVKCAVDFMLS